MRALADEVDCLLSAFGLAMWSVEIASTMLSISLDPLLVRDLPWNVAVVEMAFLFSSTNSNGIRKEKREPSPGFESTRS